MLGSRLRIWFVLVVYLLVTTAQFHHLLEHAINADQVGVALASPAVECGGGACGIPGHHHHDSDPRPLHDHTSCQICNSMLIAPARSAHIAPVRLERVGVARPTAPHQAATAISLAHLGPRGPPSTLLVA